jgi:hypothetical protein
LYHIRGEIFGDPCAGPSWHPQQLNIQLLKSKLGQDESQFNNLHFIKGANPHQTTGSKVPDFRVKKVFFSHRVAF